MPETDIDISANEVAALLQLQLQQRRREQMAQQPAQNQQAPQHEAPAIGGR